MKVFRNDQKKSKEIPKRFAPTKTAAMTGHVYYFGAFCVNEAEQQLLRNGKPVRLAPKTFDILLVLIQNKGSLVTKDKLLQQVWPGVFVAEANLSVNIANLRKALDEGCIETVPKRGYRFVADVSELNDDCADGLDQFQLIRNPRILNSVAVLPFENEGCGPAGDYLSTALMESITNTLSRSRELRVMARHTVYSCHRYNIDALTVGHELGVSSVLVGRLLPLGDQLIVRTELVDVLNGWQLWGEQYQTKVSDVLIVQQELTAEISERLRIRLSLDKKAQSRHDDHPERLSSLSQLQSLRSDLRHRNHGPS